MSLGAVIWLFGVDVVFWSVRERSLQGLFGTIYHKSFCVFSFAVCKLYIPSSFPFLLNVRSLKESNLGPKVKNEPADKGEADGSVLYSK